MICEYRSYRLHPGRMQEYLGFFHAQPAVLDLLRQYLHGFWMAESGVLNVVHHLWRYESRQARAVARAEIAAAPAMAKFFAAITPLLQSQRSIVFEGELHAPVAIDPPGCFDLFEVSMRPDAAPVSSDRALADLGDALSAGFVPVANLRRGWLETAGPVAHAMYFVRSTSLSKRHQNCASAAEGLSLAAGRGAIADTRHVLLAPVPFSPWR